MNWYKTARVRGEWWIINGSANFADSDTGEMGHEGYVIQDIQRKYAYDEFDKGEWVDWDGFKKQLAQEELSERYGEEIATNMVNKNDPAVKNACLQKLKEMGMTDEEYAIAEGKGDARQYGMEHLGWKRVAGNNIQTYTLATEDLKNIADGLYDIDNDLDDNSDELFNIEVVSSNVFFTDVPFKLISDGSPSMLMQFRSIYAEKTGWYKAANQSISPKEMKMIESLVKKIMLGNRDWTLEELQLQQNYPEIIEGLLRKAI